MLSPSDLREKNIAILGFGREGKSTLKFLIQQKVSLRNITVLDTNKDLDDLEEIKVLTGEEHLQNLDRYDIIFKSAGVPITEQLLPYQDKIVTQVQFFFDNYPGKVIAVTASKGKSTIVSLIYLLLRNAGYQVKLVGNIGTPVFDEIDIQTSTTTRDDELAPSLYDFVVIELSSYMLHHLRKHNYISILGTIFPEHLDRHGSFANYLQSKLHILEWSETNIMHKATMEKYHVDQEQYHILPYGGTSKYRWKDGYFWLGRKKLFSTDQVKIPWDHNLENITAIVALADTLKISLDLVQETVAHFTGLPHRLQELGEYGSIRRIDDAISTTPESTIAAIKTYGDHIDTIFLWWTDRGYNFEELVDYLQRYHISNIVLFPPSWEKIAKMLSLLPTKFCLLQTEDMEKAVKFAYKHTQKGKICLLSTASPSYSIWKDFEEKWDLFQKYIKELC